MELGTRDRKLSKSDATRCGGEGFHSNTQAQITLSVFALVESNPEG